MKLFFFIALCLLPFTANAQTVLNAMTCTSVEAAIKVADAGLQNVSLPECEIRPVMVPDNPKHVAPLYVNDDDYRYLHIVVRSLHKDGERFAVLTISIGGRDA